MRKGPILASTLVLALSIVSTTFVLLALTSSNWSSQTYYFAVQGTDDGTNRTTPVCTATRSPFYKCGFPEVDANGTCNIPNCTFYKPYGNNATSCRSSTELGIPRDDPISAEGLLGSAQECQQVHYAGNLQIAASFFIVCGLCLSLVLSVFTVILGFAGPTENHQTHHDADASDKVEHITSRRQQSYQRSSATPYVVFVLLFCLLAGAALQLLAQYFAVLGLTVSASPNGADAQEAQYKSNQDLANYAADDWVISKALNTYATVAWTSAVVGSAISMSVFRTPRFAKLL